MVVKLTPELLMLVNRYVRISASNRLKDVGGIQYHISDMVTDIKKRYELTQLVEDFEEYLAYLLEDNYGHEFLSSKDKLSIRKTVFMRLKSVNGCSTMKQLFIRFIMMEMQ